MKVIGLTGNIASGKTSITNYLTSKGIPVIDGDKVARDVVLPGSEGLLKIEENFGEEYISREGTLDRKKLASLVFNDSSKLDELNNILHPIIRNEFIKKIEEYKKDDKIKFIILDAALLIESKMTDLVDSLWLVSVDQDVQIQRVMDRDEVTKEVALAIINSQMPLVEKKKHAQKVIENNGFFEEVYTRVDELLKEYS